MRSATMRSIAIAVFSAACCGAVATAALAGEEPVQLKRAAGVDKVEDPATHKKKWDATKPRRKKVVAKKKVAEEEEEDSGD